MTIELWIGVTASLAFTAGMLVGNWVTNAAWLARADGKYGRTAHHCQGGFYYVIPEAEFCREYQLRTDRSEVP